MYAEKLMVTVADIARAAEISRTQAYRLADAGVIPVVEKSGRQRRVRVADAIAFLENRP